MSFISQLDPNLVITLVALVGTSAKWLYAKVRHEKTVGIEDSLWPIVEGNVLKVAESDDTVDGIRLKLTKAAQEGLARLGLKPNAITDAITAKLVERGITEVRRQVLARKTAAQLEAAIDAAGKVPDAFTPKGTMPKLDIDVQVMP